MTAVDDGLPSAEDLADMLEALCGRDDRFASHEDAVNLAWDFLVRARAGDTFCLSLIQRTRDYVTARRTES